MQLSFGRGCCRRDLSHDEGQMLAHMLGEVLVGPLAGVSGQRRQTRVPPYLRRRGERDKPMGVVLARVAADADLLVVGSHGIRELKGMVTATNDCLARPCPVSSSRRAVRMGLPSGPSSPWSGGPRAVLRAVRPRRLFRRGLADHAELGTLPLEVCLGCWVGPGAVSFYTDGEVVTLPVNHVVDGRTSFSAQTADPSCRGRPQGTRRLKLMTTIYRTGWSRSAQRPCGGGPRDSEIHGQPPWPIPVGHRRGPPLLDPDTPNLGDRAAHTLTTP